MGSKRLAGDSTIPLHYAARHLCRHQILLVCSADKRMLRGAARCMHRLVMHHLGCVRARMRTISKRQLRDKGARVTAFAMARAAGSVSVAFCNMVLHITTQTAGSLHRT
jgi:hypothetical protein